MKVSELVKVVAINTIILVVLKLVLLFEITKRAMFDQPQYFIDPVLFL